MEEMKLIRATAADADAAATLYEAVKRGEFCVWSAHYPTLEHATADAAAGCLYLMMYQDTLVGCLSVEPIPEDDDLPWRVCDGTHREVARVAVAPEHQGHGYAKRAMALLLDLLKEQGVTSVHLLAAMSNIPAFRTYQALGFDVLGQCHRYGSDYYICEKLL